MPYGTEKDEWGASSGRARSAGSSRTRGTKRRRAKRAPRARKPRATKPKAPRKRRARKPKTYVRYNPDTGARVAGITESDPRFTEWPNRKPRTRREREEFSDSFGEPSSGSSAPRSSGSASKKSSSTRATKAAPNSLRAEIAKVAEKAATDALKAGGKQVLKEVKMAGGVGAVARELGPKVLPALATLGKAGGIAAAVIGTFYGIVKIAQYERNRSRAQLIARSEELGRKYTDARAAALRAYGTNKWADVPEAVRTFIDGQYLETMRRLTLNLNATRGAIR